MSLQKSDFFLLGILSKTHGHQGAAVLVSSNYFPDNIDEVDFLFLDIENGLVPFKLESLDFKNDTSAIVKFEGINNPDQLLNYLDTDVYCHNEFNDESRDQELNKFIDYSVSVNNKIIGIIKDLIPYPENPVFQISINKKEVLIPANNDFILEINDQSQIIFMDLPSGLIEVYLED